MNATRGAAQRRTSMKDSMATFMCSECGVVVSYHYKVDRSFYARFPGINEVVGYEDIGTGDHLCLECEVERFAEDDNELDIG